MHTMRRFFERPSGAQPGRAVRTKPLPAQRLRLNHMQRDLNVMLGQHPSSRLLMGHLDLLERVMLQGGFAAVEALPLRVIAKALAQLEQLVWDWSPVGLAELRSRLAVIVKSRSAQAYVDSEGAREREAISTAAIELDMAQAAEVTEVDIAEFEAMERNWTGILPTPDTR